MTTTDNMTTTNDDFHVKLDNELETLKEFFEKYDKKCSEKVEIKIPAPISVILAIPFMATGIAVSIVNSAVKLAATAVTIPLVIGTTVVALPVVIGQRMLNPNNKNVNTDK